MEWVPSDLSAFARNAWTWLFEGDRLTRALESSFTTSLLGALAGAWAGAWAAQRIAVKAKLRDELVAELQAINVATTLTHTTANAYVQAKRQHIRELGGRLKQDQERFKAFREKMSSGELPRGSTFEIQLPLTRLSKITAPIAFLRDHILTHVHGRNRPLGLVTTMDGIADTLNDLVLQRNGLLESMRAAPQSRGVVLFYLGEADAPGKLDRTYPDLLSAIVMHTDDMIFFSVLLSKDLHAHGKEVQDRLKRMTRFTLRRRSVPTLNEVDFSDVEKEGLVPDGKEYPTWFTAFKKRQPERWWRRLAFWKSGDDSRREVSE
jgi:hypothetical protein